MQSHFGGLAVASALVQAAPSASVYVTGTFTHSDVSTWHLSPLVHSASMLHPPKQKPLPTSLPVASVSDMKLLHASLPAHPVGAAPLPSKVHRGRQMPLVPVVRHTP